MIARLLQFFLVVAFAQAANASDYYLHPLGDDAAAGTSPAGAWQTLAHAIPMLSPGDTLYLAGNASLPYQGQVEVEIDVSGTPGPGAITFSNAAAISPTSDRRGITIRGCTFRQNWKGLRMGAVHDLVIDNSLFSENIAAGLTIGLTASPDPQTGFLMTNSSILDTYGPWPAGTVADSNPAGIKVHKLTGGAIRNTLVAGTHLNRAGDYAPHGIWSDVDVTDFTIEGNVIRDIEGSAGNFSAAASSSNADRIGTWCGAISS